jgi:signal-transduction protein with cAMP-binding, CBS, and nucleotidyltransferase domain
MKANKDVMLRFKMFNCLSQEELEYLAPRALKAEFYDKEIVIEKGQFPMDKIYLIITGKVQIEDYMDETTKKIKNKELN